MAARSIWNGTIALGEIAIPVKLFSVVQQRRIHFHEVRLSDGCRIVHRRVGSESGLEIPAEQIRKAYETPEGEQVVLTDEEIAAAQGRRAKVIVIEHFVEAGQIDPIYYERPYIVGAQAGGERAYRVLHSALQRSGKVGIGSFALRTREQLAAVAPHGDALRLYTMRFADELVSSADLEIPTLTREPSDKEIQMAERLIDALVSAWEPERYEDRHREAVMGVIKRKAAGIEVETREPEAPQPVPDLLAALEQSIEARRKTAKASRAPRRTPAKPTGGSRTETRAR